jgi:hypothetical protein
LPPGHYTLVARGGNVTAMSPSQQEAVKRGLILPPLFARVDVVVSGQDVSNVAIRLQEGITVSGRVVVKTSASSPTTDLTRFQIELVARETTARSSGRPTAPLAADGTFQIVGTEPGDYRLRATAPAGSWSLRSAVLDGKDVSDLPVDVAMGQNLSGLVVTFSDVQTELSGILIDGDGRVASQLYVFVFPTDKTMWLPAARRIRSVRSTDNGSYTMAGLPAGEYFLCALTELDTMLQFEPEYLEQLIPASIKITLAEGEKKTQNLRIGR